MRRLLRRLLRLPERRDTGPVKPTWLDDQTWVCGDCKARNSWSRCICSWCGRIRSDAWNLPEEA